jgi:hypothetical protein
VDDQIKRLVEANLKLTEENNRLLKKIRRSMFWNGVFQTFYWILIIGVPIALYIFLKDAVGAYLVELRAQNATSPEVQNMLDQLKELPIVGRFFQTLGF